LGGLVSSISYEKKSIKNENKKSVIMRYNGGPHNVTYSVPLLCDSTYRSYSGYLVDYMCIDIRYTENKPDVIFKCLPYSSSFNYIDDVAVGFFRQVFTYLGFSADDDAESFMKVDKQTNHLLYDNQRMSNLFSKRDIESINAVFPICGKIVYTPDPPPPSSPSHSWWADYWWIIFPIAGGIFFILFMGFIIRHVYLSLKYGVAIRIEKA